PGGMLLGYCKLLEDGISPPGGMLLGYCKLLEDGVSPPGGMLLGYCKLLEDGVGIVSPPGGRLPSKTGCTTLGLVIGCTAPSYQLGLICGSIFGSLTYSCN